MRNRGSAAGIAMEEKKLVKGPVMKLNHPKAGFQKASESEQSNWVWATDGRRILRVARVQILEVMHQEEDLTLQYPHG
jgi:hypothetical protein